VALAAAALQFPLAHAAISTLIPGAISRAEALQNAAHLRASIPADLWAELKHERLLRPDAPVPA
jgi:D-threo-aldose 1-dehydrogenase